MAEVAEAYVTLIPSMKGSQSKITDELTGAGSAAGTAVGNAVGKNMVSSIGASMSSAGKSLTKGVTVPLLAVGAASFAAFQEVDNGLDTIQKKTGATGEDLEQMSDVMENLATSIPVTFDEAGNAVGEVSTRFGVAGQDLQDLSGKFLKFARLNDTDVSSSVDNVSKVIGAFGMNVEDAGDMLDVLNKVGQDTGVSVDTLATSLSQNAAQLQEMGMSASDAAAFLGKCDMAGLEISTTMMGMKTAMKNAAKDGQSLDTFLSDFSKTMNSNASESEKLSAAYEAFGTRAGAAIYNAVKNGKIDLEDLTGSLGDFAGSVDSTFESILDPSDEFVQVLNEMKVMGADLAKAVMPVLKDVLQTIVPIVKSLTDAWNSLSPGMQQFIVKAGMVAIAIGPILSIGGKLMSTINLIKTGFSGLTSIMSGVSSQFGGITGLMGTNISTLASTVQGKLGIAGAAVGTFFAAFTFTDWILEITGAKEALEDLGASLYDFFHQAEITSVDSTNKAMAAFEDYALRGEGTYEEVLQMLKSAQAEASAANTEVTRTDAETLQKYIDLMENGVAEARAKEAQARQLANETMIAENQMTAETLQATMDLANTYIETGAGNAEVIMANLQTAYEQYAASTDATSQETAANIQAMMDNMTTAMTSTSETMVLVAGDAATNLQNALASANEYLETGRGDTEAIIANLQTAYDMYTTQTGDSSQQVADAVESMVSSIESSSGTSISATDNMSSETVADLATISQAMSDLGITDVGQFVSAIETGMSSVQTAFSTMESEISTRMANASPTVATSISEIETAFANANLSFKQEIALPHFSMSGSFNAETGEVPTVSVSWYKRAAEEGALFTDPTLIGVGDANQPEMLIGENTLYQQIAKAVAESGGGGGDIVIPVYVGGELLDEVIVKATQRSNYRSGGR